MIIKKLTASFGNLKNQVLTLNDGLNIINLPNESGKSTWCSFIKAMFYGINTSAQRKKGFLPDKIKYMPWDGRAMEGSMDISFQGKNITIQRTSIKNAPMKVFSATYTGTAEAVSGLNTENAGDVLIGVSEDIFEKSAFIRQSGVTVSQSTDLEKKINSLSTSGDENVSYSEANSKLRTWMRKRQRPGGGNIPYFEKRINDIDGTLQKIEKSNTENAELRAMYDALSIKKKQLEDELNAYEAYVKAEDYMRLKSASNAYTSAKHNKEYTEFAIRHQGHIPTKEEIDKTRTSATIAQTVRVKVHEKEEQMEKAASNLSNCVVELDSSYFKGKSLEEAQSEAASKGSELDGLRRIATSKPTLWIILLCVFGGLGILFGILSFVKQTVLLYVAAVCLVAAVVCFVLYFVNKSKIKKFNEMYQNKLSEYGLSSREELDNHLKNYEWSCKKKHECDAEYNSAANELESSKSEFDDSMSILKSYTDKVIKNYSGLDEALVLIAELEQKYTAMTEAAANFQSAEKVYNSLTETIGNISGLTFHDAANVPKRSKAEIQHEYNKVCDDLSEVEKNYNMAMGRLSEIGDPIVLATEKQINESNLKKSKIQYNALNIAIDALDQANTEVQTRIAPKINVRAGNIMSKLTAGKYSEVFFDSELSAKAVSNNDIVSRENLYLSGGTNDQLYLSLRLALADELLPSDEKCPIILDDALVNFDDERMKQALDYLIQLSNERQIILFTCQSREADYLNHKN